MSLITYREWKSNEVVINEFDVARTGTQGLAALKEMDPKIRAFGANLAQALGSIEGQVKGFTRKFVTKMVNTLHTAADLPPAQTTLLKNKLMQAIPLLPREEANIMNPGAPQMR